MLRDEHINITMDAWTSCASNSYQLLSVDFLITDLLELVTLPFSCTKSEGSTTGQDLAHAIERMVVDHDLAGRVVAYTTYCGPLMLKARRLLQQGNLYMQMGCCNR